MVIFGCGSMRLFVKVGVNVVLLVLYAYFFGQYSVQKYLKKGVIITNVDEGQSLIKTPGQILDFLCILLFSHIQCLVINIVPFDTSHGWKSEVKRCINKTSHKLHQCIKDSAYPAEEIFQLKQNAKPNITNLRSNNSVKVTPFFRNFYHGLSQSLQLDHGVITNHYVSTVFVEVKIRSFIMVTDSKIQYEGLNPAGSIPKTMMMLKPNEGQILAYLKVQFLHTIRCKMYFTNII